MKAYEKMNQYLANLAVWNVKLHNLHWNVKGMQFLAIHNYTESLYDKVFRYFDDVAERIKMAGLSPLAILSEYLKVADLKEVEVKDYSAEEVLDLLRNDLELMSSLAKSIREIASEEDDYATANMMEDMLGAYEKDLWFIRSMRG